MTEPIYRTVYQVEVFSEGPHRSVDDPNMSDLEAISYDITEGPCIGDFTQVSSEIVPPEDVQAHLIRIGNDGTFFDLDGLEAHYVGPPTETVDPELEHLIAEEEEFERRMRERQAEIDAGHNEGEQA